MDGESEVARQAATLRITPATLAVVSELDEFKGAWRAIGRIAPDRLSSLRRVATIESVGSSTRIEGARLSDREVERLLARVDARSLATRDEQEVAGYAAVMETVFEHWAEIAPTESHIWQLHRDLLQFTDKDERHRGAYKTLPNHVEAFGPDGEPLGIVFATASPFETPGRMADLVSWTHERERAGDLHPLLVIAVFIVVFLAIHPFQDGNGRLSRILTTLMLLRAGYSYVPFGSLESLVEDTKDSYYRALRATQASFAKAESDWEPWISYFLRTLQRHKRRLAARLESERLLLGSLPELQMRLLELVRERGRLSVAEAVKATGAKRSTLKDHLRALTELGHLRRHGAGRGTWYGLG